MEHVGKPGNVKAGRYRVLVKISFMESDAALKPETADGFSAKLRVVGRSKTTPLNCGFCLQKCMV